FAVWNTTHNEGPFAFQSIDHSVLATQLYLAVAALSTLFLVAVVTEREAFAGRLAASRSRLVEEAGAEVVLAIEELRQIAHGIHPVALNLGLAAAIKSVADRSSVAVAILALPSERL